MPSDAKPPETVTSSDFTSKENCYSSFENCRLRLPIFYQKRESNPPIGKC